MIKILCVGKMNQKGLQDSIQYYIKQCPIDVEIIEVFDEATEQGKIVEGQRLLSKIKESDVVVALAILGKPMTSEAFASFLDEKMT
jgi:23S rRNA (pseudouridine1915-N3)-methyltransferase